MAEHTGNSYTGLQYRLRASSPMPLMDGTLVLHTFGAEINDSSVVSDISQSFTIYECTTVLPASSEFRGQGLEGGLMSAQFSRIGDKTGLYFQGREVGPPTYIDEDGLNFNY